MPDLTATLIIVAPSGLSRKKFREFQEGVGIPEVSRNPLSHEIQHYR
jgi:hypothetical protein